jgi:Ser/Thr protein kinase RdoA (MazF antagonist)
MEIKRKIKIIPTANQITEICYRYDIGNLISIIEVIENTANINIKILTNKGTFVIRISSVDHNRYNFIMKVLTTLDSNNVPVLLPLKNIEGEYISSFGLKYIQVTNFNKGHAFNYSEKQAYSSGRILRRFHDVLINTSEEIKPSNSVYPSLSTINKGIKMMEGMDYDISKEELNLVTSLYEQITDAWESNSKDLPVTIVHGDWHQGNQLYSDSEKVSCIMDFDFMTKAERLFDVAYALWHFRIYKESMNIGKAFLQGYGALTIKEIELLPLEIARINYFFICTSPLALNPKQELKNQIEHQYPFIMWALSSEGKIAIKNLCKISDYQ